jgi:hypothetical protein
LYVERVDDDARGRARITILVMNEKYGSAVVTRTMARFAVSSASGDDAPNAFMA